MVTLLLLLLGLTMPMRIIRICRNYAHIYAAHMSDRRIFRNGMANPIPCQPPGWLTCITPIISVQYGLVWFHSVTNLVIPR